MSGKAIDETGNRYGKLVVLGRAGTRSRYAAWLCQCDCGNQTTVTATHLRRGMTRSCGCLSNKLPSGEAAFNSMFSKMKRDAKRRGYDWLLSKEFVKHITSSICYYCGCEPSQKASRNHPDLNGEYYFNGLDRIDNTIGYIESNVVPCCKHCNYAKAGRTQQEFYDWVKRAYEHTVRCSKAPDETRSESFTLVEERRPSEPCQVGTVW